VDVRGGQPLIPGAGDVAIRLVTDGRTWDRYKVHTGVDACVSLWVSGLPDPCDRASVRVRLNGADLPAVYVSSHDRESLTQVNALLPAGLPPGAASITLVFQENESQAVDLELV
jgi:uncharacterized protein (TIGR03437 family)